MGRAIYRIPRPKFLAWFRAEMPWVKSLWVIHSRAMMAAMPAAWVVMVSMIFMKVFKKNGK